MPKWLPKKKSNLSLFVFIFTISSECSGKTGRSGVLEINIKIGYFIASQRFRYLHKFSRGKNIWRRAFDAVASYASSAEHILSIRVGFIISAGIFNWFMLECRGRNVHAHALSSYWIITFQPFKHAKLKSRSKVAWASRFKFCYKLKSFALRSWTLNGVSTMPTSESRTQTLWKVNETLKRTTIEV